MPPKKANVKNAKKKPDEPPDADPADAAAAASSAAPSGVSPLHRPRRTTRQSQTATAPEPAPTIAPAIAPAPAHQGNEKEKETDISKTSTVARRRWKQQPKKTTTTTTATTTTRGKDDQGGKNKKRKAASDIPTEKEKKEKSDGTIDESASPAKKKRRKQTAAEKKTKPPRMSWDARLAELLAYKQEHGDCNVPRNYKDVSLANFVKNQRHKKTLLDREGISVDGDGDGKGNQKKTIGGMSLLTPDQYKALNDIGFSWTVIPTHTNDVLGYSWNKRLKQLEAYKQEHGHVNVPQEYKPDPGLGQWVRFQRQQKQLFDEEQQQEKQEGNTSSDTTNTTNKQKSSIHPQGIAALNKLGFTWTLATPQETWNLHLQELVAYKEEHGDCNVPRCYKPNKALGNWVHKQRDMRLLLDQGKPSRLNDVRLKELERIGFTWAKRKPRTTSSKDKSGGVVVADEAVVTTAAAAAQQDQDQQQVLDAEMKNPPSSPLQHADV